MSEADEMTNPSTNANFLNRLRAGLFKPVDISFLVLFRILFGGIMLWETFRYFSHGWISRYFIEPSINFTYYGFSWVQPWEGHGMYIHFVVLGLAATCIMVGFLYRLATPVFFLAFTYVFLLDQTRYLNHFYLVCLISFLMCFLPAERSFSVDAWLRPKIRSTAVPAWTLWLLRIQLGIPYFFGGIAKLNSDWILGGEPMRAWLQPLTALPKYGYIFASDPVVYGFAYGGLLFDLLVVPLLLWRRTRLIGCVAAVAFNLINATIFNIGIFPWFMLGALFIFFAPDLPRRAVRGLLWTPDKATRDKKPSETPVRFERVAETESRALSTASQNLVIGLLAVHLAIQFLVPLRHFLYPGNVSWTEEGHDFSWHMKLRRKTGNAIFTITDPASGRTWTVVPAHFVKPHQLSKMTTKPECLLQFAHYLAEEKRREGYDNVEVRAHVTASLNGRQPQLLIDPTTDLTKEQESLLPDHWIMPLTTPLESR